MAHDRNQTGLKLHCFEDVKENNSATIADLHNVNKVLKKVKTQEREIYYEKVGRKEELQIVGIRDAWFKTDE